MKTALVLSGGGAKGAFQAGVLSSIERSGIRPDIVCGTSAGAINAAGLAFCGSSGLCELWRSIRSWRDVFSVNWSTAVLRSDGVLNAEPLRNMLAGVCHAYPRFAVSVSKVRLEDGALMYSTGGDPSFVDSVVASCSIPAIVSPAIDPLTKDHYVDGGTRENVPLKRAIDLGADRIIVVLCSPWRRDLEAWEPRPGFLEFIEVGMRSLDIAMHENMVNDIETCLDMNGRPGKRDIEVIVYAPSKEPMGVFDFEPDKIEKAIEAGKRAEPIVLKKCGATTALRSG